MSRWEGRELEHMPMDHPQDVSGQVGSPSGMSCSPIQSCPHSKLWGRDFEVAFPSGQGLDQDSVGSSHEPQAAAGTIRVSQSSFSSEIHPRQRQPAEQWGWSWGWTGNGVKIFKIFN